MSSTAFLKDETFNDNQLNNELNLIEFYMGFCEKLLKIYPTILLTIGTLGNLISFGVLMYGSRKKSTTFSYLSCLALIDLAVVATFTINFISLYNFDKDLQDNLVYCKMYAFLIYYLPQYSAWTLSIVSVDRMLGLLQVNITHRYSRSTTIRVAGELAPKSKGNGMLKVPKIVKQRITQGVNSKNRFSRLFSTFFSKRRLKKPVDVPPEVIANTQTKAEPVDKKTFFVVKCFNSIISLYNIRISEKYRAFVIVGVIGVLLFLLNSHFLFIYNNSNSQLDNDTQLLASLTSTAQNYNLSGLDLNTIENLLRRKKIDDSTIMMLLNGVNVIKCSLEHNQKYKQFYKIWVHVDSIVNVYLPFAVMIISSFMIIMCVLKSMKAAGNYRYHKIARNISVMLVSINVLFIVLTAPIVIQLAIDASSGVTTQNITLPMNDMYWQSAYSEEPMIMLSPDVKFSNISDKYQFYRTVNKEIVIIAKKRLIKLICIVIMNSNHACNIMVYCLIGREFRRHFMCAIRRLVYGDSKYKQQYLKHPQYVNNKNLKMSTKLKKLDECDCILSTSSSVKHVSAKSIYKNNKKFVSNEDIAADKQSFKAQELTQDDNLEFMQMQRETKVEKKKSFYNLQISTQV